MGRCCGSWASWRSPWRRTRGWVCVYMHVCMPVVNRPQYLTRHRHRRLYHHEDRRWPSCPRPATTTTWPSPTKCVDKCTQMCNLIGPHAPTNQIPTNIHTTNNSPWATPPRPSRATGPAWPPTRAASPTRTSTWAWRCRRQVGCETKQVCLWTRQQRAPTDAFTFHISTYPPPPKKQKHEHTHHDITGELEAASEHYLRAYELDPSNAGAFDATIACLSVWISIQSDSQPSLHPHPPKRIQQINHAQQAPWATTAMSCRPSGPTPSMTPRPATSGSPTPTRSTTARGSTWAGCTMSRGK